MKRLFLIPFVAASLLVPAVCAAQFNIFTGAFSISLTLEPERPQAYEAVTLRASSLFTNLSSANVSWYVNDSLAASGEGLTTFRTVAGAPGTQTTISVRATSSLGGTLSGETKIAPSDAEIVWESTSLVPPFYKGRALAGSGSTIRAEAFVRLAREDGTLIPSKDILYTWSKNGSPLSSASGRGRSTFVTEAPLLSSADVISVRGASLDGTLEAEARTIIPATDTVLLLYPEHSLFGAFFNAAIGKTFTASNTEVLISAFPYFAEAIAPDDKRISYAWNVNGAPVAEDPAEPHKLILGSSGDGVRAVVDLSLSHTTNWLEAAHGLWTIDLIPGGIPAGDPFSPFGE